MLESGNEISLIVAGIPVEKQSEEDSAASNSREPEAAMPTQPQADLSQAILSCLSPAAFPADGGLPISQLKGASRTTSRRRTPFYLHAELVLTT